MYLIASINQSIWSNIVTCRIWSNIVTCRLKILGKVRRDTNVLNILLYFCYTYLVCIMLLMKYFQKLTTAADPMLRNSRLS